jgi:hypothetical protein
MDKIFFSRIQQFRAQRMQSPYVMSPENSPLLNKLQKNKEGMGGRDYYGESIKSVQDYRSWLRGQRKLEREGPTEGEVLARTSPKLGVHARVR